MIKNHPDKKLLNNVIKTNGEYEVFSTKKLRKSLQRTGLKPKYCSEIARKVSDNISPGIRSKDIFNQTYKLVSKQSSIAAIRYSLKKSILELGPTGFVFEYFVSKYFETIGFKTSIDNILQGEFVRHEVDIVAIKKNYKICVECKFHNISNIKNDVKVVLYVKARWDDLKNGPAGKNLREFYLVSNTSFTKDAIVYAKGTGLHLLGVNAPEDESFLDKIEKYKLYPITSLKRLKSIYCQELIREKIILCTDLLNEREMLIKIGMSEEEIKNIFKDIEKVMS
jgi:hypothetical protein